MILKQVFKTYDGAHKRAAFETAHNRAGWRYGVVRFYNGVEATGFATPEQWKGSTWRLRRMSAPRKGT